MTGAQESQVPQAEPAKGGRREKNMGEAVVVPEPEAPQAPQPEAHDDSEWEFNLGNTDTLEELAEVWKAMPADVKKRLAKKKDERKAALGAKR